MADFYEPWQLESNTKNQVSFRKNLGKGKIHKFREVEIISETEVKVILEFYFPYIEKTFLITNDVKDRLVAKDPNGVSIYISVNISDEEPHLVKWEIIKVLHDFPYDLHKYFCYRLDFFSPRFDRYMRYEQIKQQFVIYDTYTSKEIAAVPKDYMSFNSEEKIVPQMVINRLQWFDSSRIRIVDEEGTEKILDIDDNFKEINFNVIPIFNQISGKEWFDTWHVLLSRKYVEDKVMQSKRKY